MKKALAARDIACIVLKGSHRARLAQANRFQNYAGAVTMILSFSDDIDSTPPLGAITDVAIFGIEPPKRVIDEVLSHTIAPRGTPPARVHLIDTDITSDYASINLVHIQC
jgi:hypothetical protein